MKDYQFEVCANSVESCIAAQAGGADRVELCAGIPEGGTTPSYGDILIAREVLQQTKLHIIVRPRGGDFLYSSTEQRIMLKDIENARRRRCRHSIDGAAYESLTRDVRHLPPCFRCMQKSTKSDRRYYRIRMQPHPNFRTATYSRARHSPSERAPTTNIESSMLYHNSAVSMGGTVHIDEYTHTITTAERVKRTIGALKASPLAPPP